LRNSKRKRKPYKEDVLLLVTTIMKQKRKHQQTIRNKTTTTSKEIIKTMTYVLAVSTGYNTAVPTAPAIPPAKATRTLRDTVEYVLLLARSKGAVTQ
jgi:hypothetical protein